MNAATPLERRFAQLCIALGIGARICADDVTDNGSITIDPAGAPNARQNGIGSLFNQWARRGLIVDTGQNVRSKAPRRKGGKDSVWEITEAGVLWARNVLAVTP
jgi:hypothetical protein